MNFPSYFPIVLMHNRKSHLYLIDKSYDLHIQGTYIPPFSHLYLNVSAFEILHRKFFRSLLSSDRAVSPEDTRLFQYLTNLSQVRQAIKLYKNNLLQVTGLEDQVVCALETNCSLKLGKRGILETS